MSDNIPPNKNETTTLKDVKQLGMWASLASLSYVFYTNLSFALYRDHHEEHEALNSIEVSATQNSRFVWLSGQDSI